VHAERLGRREEGGGGGGRGGGVKKASRRPGPYFPNRVVTPQNPTSKLTPFSAKIGFMIRYKEPGFLTPQKRGQNTPKITKNPYFRAPTQKRAILSAIFTFGENKFPKS